jgi:hypothetical protein
LASIPTVAGDARYKTEEQVPDHDNIRQYWQQLQQDIVPIISQNHEMYLFHSQQTSLHL